MFNREKTRQLRSTYIHLLNRGFFVYTAWLLYGISRVCYFIKLRYNRKTHSMEEFQYHRIFFKLMLILKSFPILQQCMFYFTFGAYLWLYVLVVENHEAQNFLISCLIQAIVLHAVRRLVVFLHSKTDRTIIKDLLHEIFYVNSTMERKFGLIYRCDLSLLSLYLLKLMIFYIMMDSLWYKPYFMWVNFFYWVLMEYCILGYFVYQLLVLNWCLNITTFLQRFIAHHENCDGIKRSYHHRLTCLFKLHLRISKLHKSINKKLSWLTNCIYLTIFTCILNMQILIECSVFGKDPLENKFYIISDGCLGPVFVPILNVLIMAVCTDRFRNSELALQQQIVIINEMYMTKGKHLRGLNVINNEHSSLIIHQKLDPMQNLIILSTKCDREFAFDFMLTVITTALSFIQYTISNGGKIDECQSHK
ncbi:LOW QUALITY PROTEIN: gustatory receptor-like 43a [Drosophila tropicalis]|uniref:LOW QUALITY PROTEIN: gustatory receptor-like 43a n=1 Tax=Drosophila tropicalis TaxID=46794 RepID=UPI0035AC09CE